MSIRIIISIRRDGVAMSLATATACKSGTTWAQLILLQRLHGHEDPVPDVNRVSPWIDARFHGIDREVLMKFINALTGRRFFKSHLPLDGLPYFPQVRYLIIGRDPRDVFMSLFNHYRGYTEAAFERFNAEDAVGADMPRCPDDPRELWRQWITRGWFDWEEEGYPFDLDRCLGR